MKKLVVLAIVLLVLASAAAVAYRTGWLARLPIPALARLVPAPTGAAPGTTSGASPATPGGTSAAPGTEGAPGAGAPAPGSAEAGATPGGADAPPAALPAAAGRGATGEPLIAPRAFDGNVASIDFGATVETWLTDTNDSPDHQEFIDGDKETNWSQLARVKSAGEVVVSFFAHETMLVDRIVLVAPRIGYKDQLKLYPKDIEIWVSSAQTLDGPFQKVASGTLPPVAAEGAEAALSFSPVEARFLKFRALNNQDGAQAFLATELKVMEAKRADYVPLLTRHPELQWPGGPNAQGPVASSTTAAGPPCGVAAPAGQPSHPESRSVLLIGERRGEHLAGTMFENVRVPDEQKAAFRQRVQFALPRDYVEKVTDGIPVEERGVLTRATFRFMYPRQARTAFLAPAVGIDTVVLGQMCGVPRRMGALSPAFKQALMAWVAAGHKLIIQDSDDCTPGPDYSFVPYRFKTDNPGARGAKGHGLRFVEANQMLQPRENRPGFLDVDAWLGEKRHHRNELGDANTFVGWDGNWCGQLSVKNVNNVTGFALAYAHYGRGLIIYDGFDNDQTLEPGYDQVVVRELAQGFDPDNLPCAARLGNFVLTTETPLLQRAAVAGRTYTYPLTLISNQGYSGTVNLSASPVAAGGSFATRFEPATVPLTGEGASSLAVTLPATLPNPSFALEVKGQDAAGTSSMLCLQFAPPTTGEIAVVSALAPPSKTRKNVEIILDASGSMKALLAGKKSRWDVALETLDEVLTNLPSDFNVGLRMYGHRELSSSPKTCTDTDLLVPVRKLDRALILKRATSFKPKGETPLVYSALQTPADLKSLGGGTVILITDGEESCKGDPVKAAAELKASGLDIRLNIVGFALKNPKTQKELAGFSEATGGLFYSAESGSGLADALMLAAVEQFPYTVYDASGKVVLKSQAGSGTDQLPPGDYKVVVKAGTKELVAPRVNLAAGQSITLTIGIKKGQLVLQ